MYTDSEILYTTTTAGWMDRINMERRQKIDMTNPTATFNKEKVTMTKKANLIHIIYIKNQPQLDVIYPIRLFGSPAVINLIDFLPMLFWVGEKMSTLLNESSLPTCISFDIEFKLDSSTLDSGWEKPVRREYVQTSRDDGFHFNCWDKENLNT